MTTHGHAEDAACAVAHGAHEHEHRTGERTLVAVFASPVAGYLLRYGADLGYTGLLLEPDAARAAAASVLGFPVLAEVPSDLDDGTDVVLTDHHRDELGVVLRDALATKARWIGIMGNPRHAGPHVAALTELGVASAGIARVHRPIGLNIGSRTPPEIAIATLAGLLADRNGRPGGLEFLVAGCALTRSSGLNCAIDTVTAAVGAGPMAVGW
ncbi:MAG TPA: XdhC family protein [Streptosporangiaceae bacterium]|nr:XdhC family protein [Streptosporangiaceae bacterium]